MSENIVILGGGVGGVVAATELRKHLGRKHRIILVDKDGQHLYAPSLLWVLNGSREPHALTKDLACLERKGIEVVKEEVLSVDLDSKQVRTGTQTIQYDWLVVSLGSDLDFEAIPGLRGAGETFYNLEGVVALRDRLRTFRGCSVAVVIASLPFKCPAAPYEAAFIMEAHLRSRGVEARVDIYTPEKLPMKVAGPDIGKSLVGMLESRDIGFHPEHNIAEVDQDDGNLRFQNDDSARADLLAYVPVHRAPTVVSEAGLTDGQGWISVDPQTLGTAHENVYAIGDVACVRLSSGMNLPMAGVFAHGEAKVVARNIVAQTK
ncbi:MAG: NAD(P)/FAD-dependent oxidoreductase, partial [Candidatus Thermoplasmatota archaeon]|nr:NAD(P)/FAD-dependent oxidoreductase [Candidatus Thermoplasmatota archaeon]